jgi:hypothetical protein
MKRFTFIEWQTDGTTVTIWLNRAGNGALSRVGPYSLYVMENKCSAVAKSRSAPLSAGSVMVGKPGEQLADQSILPAG